MPVPAQASQREPLPACHHGWRPLEPALHKHAILMQPSVHAGSACIQLQQPVAPLEGVPDCGSALDRDVPIVPYLTCKVSRHSRAVSSGLAERVSTPECPIITPPRGERQRDLPNSKSGEGHIAIVKQTMFASRVWRARQKIPLVARYVVRRRGGCVGGVGGGGGC